MRFSHLYLYVLENFGIWGLGLLVNTMYLNSTNNAKCNNNPRLRNITIHVYNLFNKSSVTSTRYQIEKRNVFVLFPYLSYLPNVLQVTQLDYWYVCYVQ